MNEEGIERRKRRIRWLLTKEILFSLLLLCSVLVARDALAVGLQVWHEVFPDNANEGCAWSRFYKVPSCMQFTIRSVLNYGPFEGMTRAQNRVSRCRSLVYHLEKSRSGGTTQP